MGVFRVSLVPCFMGSHDGTLDIRLTPDVLTTTTIYRSLLRVDSTYAIFQSRSSKYYLNFDFSSDSTSMFGLVPCQLLPNGVQRVSFLLRNAFAIRPWKVV